VAKKKSLYEQVIESRPLRKRYLAFFLIGLGLMGLVLPFLPGLALLFLGFMLIFPKKTEEFIRRVRGMWQQ